jgi:hypothetical protein
MHEAEKSPKPRRASTTLAKKMEALDALTLSFYGYTCRKLHNLFYSSGYADGYQKGFDDGYEQGFKDGYEQGIKSGRRLAKGKPPFPRPRDARKILGHDLLVLQFVHFVKDLMDEKGITLPAAVSKYRADFGRAWKGRALLSSQEILPSQEQLLRLYKRAIRPNAIDDGMRRAHDQLKLRLNAIDDLPRAHDQLKRGSPST